MGSNEAGEQRAGKEETLPGFPDGLIHPRTDVHKHTQVQTHSLVHGCSAKVYNHISMQTYGEDTQTDILMQTTALFVKLQPDRAHTVFISECVLWVVDEEGIERWKGNLLYCLCRSSYVNVSVPLASFYSITSLAGDGYSNRWIGGNLQQRQRKCRVNDWPV